MEAKLEASLVEIVKRAGDAILKVYESDFEVTNKVDDSPLTQADLAAHRIIVAGLSQMSPDIPIISEESEPPDYGRSVNAVCVPDYHVHYGVKWTRYRGCTALVDPSDHWTGLFRVLSGLGTPSSRTRGGSLSRYPRVQKPLR